MPRIKILKYIHMKIVLLFHSNSIIFYLMAFETSFSKKKTLKIVTVFRTQIFKKIFLVLHKLQFKTSNTC